MSTLFRKFNGESVHGRRVVSDVRPAQATRPMRAVSPRRDVRPKIEERSHKPRDRRFVRPGYIIFVLIVIGVMVFSLFWSASLALVITPQSANFKLEKDVKIVIDAREITHDVVKREEGKSAESKKYSQRASGTLIVFNNFSADSQILVERTRFESPAGLIFRSASRVMVPGKSGDKPSSVEVSVVADAPGEKYNIGFSDFTIPGFAGTPKFQKFFARSKTEIKGGAAGEGRIVGKEEAGLLLAKLEAEVKRELEGGLGGRIPADMVAFPDKVEREPILRITDPPIGAPADTFFAEARGGIRTLAVEKKAFSRAVARALFNDDARADMYELVSSPQTIVKNIDMDYKNRKVSVTLFGPVRFLGIVDTEDVKRKVLEAKNEADLDAIFAASKGSISKVEKTFRPAFFKRIPSRSSRIFISITEGIDTKR